MIVDTHVFVEAAKQALVGSDGPESRLFELILEKCPVVVWTPALGKELRPQLRKMGIRFPQQMPGFLRKLDKQPERKLRFLSESELVTLTKAQRKPFVKGLRDDAHLYQAALSCGRFVITCDQGQHEASQKILAATGVTVVPLDDLVDAEERTHRSGK